MNAHQLLRQLVDTADSTGCEGCAVCDGAAIAEARSYLAANPTPPKSRIVVHMDSGAIHNIVASDDSVEILLKDDDTEGADPTNIRTDAGGRRFHATIGPWEFDPRQVEELFARACGADHKLMTTDSTRVVLVLSGGVIQNILADRAGRVEVLVKDYDIGDDHRSLPVDGKNIRFAPIEGPQQIDAETVAECFKTVSAHDDYRDAMDDGL